MSVPVLQSNQQLRADIKQRIASGEFNLGTPVLDNGYTKVVLTSEGNRDSRFSKEVPSQRSLCSKCQVRLCSDEEYDNNDP